MKMKAVCSSDSVMPTYCTAAFCHNLESNMFLHLYEDLKCEVCHSNSSVAENSTLTGYSAVVEPV
jgi:hypothetical protein